MVPDRIKTAFKDTVPITRVTNVRTIAHAATEKGTIYKEMQVKLTKY